MLSDTNINTNHVTADYRPASSILRKAFLVKVNALTTLNTWDNFLLAAQPPIFCLEPNKHENDSLRISTCVFSDHLVCSSTTTWSRSSIPWRSAGYMEVLE
jgi:hypothetical protein